MLLNLLSAASGSVSGSTSTSGTPTTGSPLAGILLWVVLIGGFVLMFVFSSRRQKKERAAQEKKMASLAVGNKVKTIGLICGEIVEVDDTTVVIRTGSDDYASFVRVEKRAVYEVIPEETEGIDYTEDVPDELPESEIVDLDEDSVEDLTEEVVENNDENA